MVKTAALIGVILIVSAFWVGALAKEPRKYTCEEIRSWVNLLGIEFVLREAKKRGADDATIQKMRKQCGV